MHEVQESPIATGPKRRRPESRRGDPPGRANCRGLPTVDRVRLSRPTKTRGHTENWRLIRASSAVGWRAVRRRPPAGIDVTSRVHDMDQFNQQLAEAAQWLPARSDRAAIAPACCC